MAKESVMAWRLAAANQQNGSLAAIWRKRNGWLMAIQSVENVEALKCNAHVSKASVWQMEIIGEVAADSGYRLSAVKMLGYHQLKAYLASKQYLKMAESCNENNAAGWRVKAEAMAMQQWPSVWRNIQ